MKNILKKKVKWCPQHGYPEPCAKCYGMTEKEWQEFYKSFAKAVGVNNGS